MADAGPNYSIERRRLELQNLEHTQTVERGKARIQEIEGHKTILRARLELAIAELDAEVQSLQVNEKALQGQIQKNIGNMAAMVKE